MNTSITADSVKIIKKQTFRSLNFQNNHNFNIGMFFKEAISCIFEDDS